MMTKRFKSCFVCCVDIDETKIVLEDANHQQFFIDRATATKETIDSFKLWFEHVYLKGIPQVLTVFEYDIAKSADDMPIMLVKRMISSGVPATQANVVPAKEK